MMTLRPIRTIRVQAPGAITTNPVDAAWERIYAEANARLLARMEKYEVPDAPWVPAQDIALVYRLPNEYKGSLVLPERYREGHDRPHSIGILIYAGPEAMDVLESHGVLPGDFVKFARFAGEEEAASRVEQATSKEERQVIISEEMAKKKLLELQVPFIHGSADLRVRLGLTGEEPTMERVRQVDSKGVVHLIQPIVKGQS